MKCPECGYDQKVKLGLKCAGCGYEFAFNPKEWETLGITDGKFLATIRSASENGTTFFTENQLYAAYCRRQRYARRPLLIAGIVVLIAAAFVLAVTFKLVALLLAGVGVLLIFLARGKLGSPQPAQFRALLQRWKSSGKAIEALIEEPSLHEPPPQWSEPDIFDYGVERILLVEREILVDLFVKNDVHAEQRMLVLAESGYPEYLLPLARRMLEERPDLPVYLLHDASTRGMQMKDRVLRNALLPLDGHPITDLGMFPADFRNLGRTQRYDSNNRLRSLPVDALMLRFLTMGLTAAMAQGVPFSSIIEAHHAQTEAVHGGFDFG